MSYNVTGVSMASMSNIESFFPDRKLMQMTEVQIFKLGGIFASNIRIKSVWIEENLIRWECQFEICSIYDSAKQWSSSSFSWQLRSYIPWGVWSETDAVIQWFLLIWTFQWRVLLRQEGGGDTSEHHQSYLGPRDHHGVLLVLSLLGSSFPAGCYEEALKARDNCREYHQDDLRGVIRSVLNIRLYISSREKQDQTDILPWTRPQWRVVARGSPRRTPRLALTVFLCARSVSTAPAPPPSPASVCPATLGWAVRRWAVPGAPGGRAVTTSVPAAMEVSALRSDWDN